jgi:predicted secreted protein
MAERVGADFLLAAGGTLIGGATGVTTTLDANQIDIIEKTAGASGRWNRRLGGLKGHTSSVELNWLAGGENIIGRENASLELDLGSGLTVVPGVTELSLSMEMSLEPVGGIDKARWAFFIPNRKDITLSVTLNYIDPTDTGGDVTQAVLDAINADTTLAAQVTVGTFTASGDVKLGSLDFTTDADAIAPFSFEAMSQGAWTKTDGDADSGLVALLDNFFAADPPALAFVSGELDAQGDPVLSTTKYEGSGFVTSIEITVPDEDEVTASAEITGTGELVDAEVTA